MSKKYGRTYWKDCVRPEMYDSFIEKIVIQKGFADLVDGIEEFAIERSDGLVIYVPQEDIKEYIERNKQ